MQKFLAGFAQAFFLLNEAFQDFDQVPGLFAGVEQRGVVARDHVAEGGEGFRERGALGDLFAYLFQEVAELAGLHAFEQDVEALHDGQAGLDQAAEFAVEHDELAHRDLAFQAEDRREIDTRLDREDEVALVGVVPVDFRLAGPVDDAFDDLAVA